MLRTFHVGFVHADNVGGDDAGDVVDDDGHDDGGAVGEDDDDGDFGVDDVDFDDIVVAVR